MNYELESKVLAVDGEFDMSEKKTESQSVRDRVMVAPLSERHKADVQLCEERTEQVQNFRYLVKDMHENGRVMGETSNR